MRRSLPFRLFAALFAPWLAFSVAQPLALHDCPVHSVHAAATASMADHMMMADGAMDHAAAPAHRHASHGSHRQCCCPDSSCASLVVALVSPALPHAWVPVEIQRNVRRGEVNAFPPSNAEHVLPFANGPPAARV